MGTLRSGLVRSLECRVAQLITVLVWTDVCWAGIVLLIAWKKGFSSLSHECCADVPKKMPSITVRHLHLLCYSVQRHCWLVSIQKY
jgi:hypothetical protein